jgi:predicted RNase H-like HicB family nuclease
VNIFTAYYVMGNEGWIVAFVEEYPNIVMQGRTIEEARACVIDAIGAMLECGREDYERRTGERPLILRETLTLDEPAGA